MRKKKKEYAEIINAKVVHRSFFKNKNFTNWINEIEKKFTKNVDYFINYQGDYLLCNHLVLKIIKESKNAKI